MSSKKYFDQQIPSFLDYLFDFKSNRIPAQNQKLKQAKSIEDDEKNENSENDLFVNFIVGILKRDADLPILK